MASKQLRPVRAPRFCRHCQPPVYCGKCLAVGRQWIKVTFEPMEFRLSEMKPGETHQETVERLLDGLAVDDIRRTAEVVDHA